MIDYAVLCRAIEDWKAGNAPSIPVTSGPPASATETVVDGYEAAETDIDAEVGDVDAGEGEVEADAEGEGEVEAEGGEPQQDRTIIYQMPEIVDEGEGEAEAEEEA